MIASEPQRLIATIETGLRSVLEGNNPRQVPIEWGPSSSEDFAFTVELEIGWRCATSWSKHPGVTVPAGSTRVRDQSEGDGLFEQIARGQAEREGYVAALIAGIAADPAAGMGLEPSRLAQVDGAAHYSSSGTGSEAQGESACGCLAGRVTCPCCDGSGKSGAGSCSQCGGVGTTLCPTCGGGRQVEYMTCHASGGFVFRGIAEIHSVVTPKVGIPPHVRRMVGDHVRAKDAGWYRDNVHWTVVSSGSQNGCGCIVLAGTLPTATRQFHLGGQDFVAEAFGATGEVAPLPPFLDALLEDGNAVLENFAGDPASAIAAISKARVLANLFEQVFVNRKDAAGLVHRQTHGAASQETLAAAEVLMRRGLRRVGRPVVNRVWLVGAVLALVTVPLLSAAGLWRPNGVGMVAASVAPAIATWLAASLFWRRQVRRLFGDRVPKVGPRHAWLTIPLALGLAACIVGANAVVEHSSAAEMAATASE